MSQNESSSDTTPSKDDEAKQAAEKKREFNRQRLERAITPQGSSSSGRREIYRAPPHFQLQPCVFQKWTKFESLPIEQACFVLLGYEPPPVPCLRFKPDIDNPSPTLTWSRPPEYYDVLRSLVLSILHEKIHVKEIPEYQYITQHVLWPELIRWARLKSYSIPKELEDIVAKMKPVVPVLAPQAAPVVPTSNSQSLPVVTPAPATGDTVAVSDAPAATVAPVQTIEPAVALSGASVVSNKGDWPAMSNLAWGEISIAILGGKYESETGLGANSLLLISASGETTRPALAQLNLTDKRTGNPTSDCVILVALAEGTEKRKVTTSDKKNPTRIKRLSAELRKYFHIEGSPFVCEGGVYAPAFSLTDNRGKADERAERDASMRMVSADRLKEEGRELSDNGTDADSRITTDEWAKKHGGMLDPLID